MRNHGRQRRAEKGLNGATGGGNRGEALEGDSLTCKPAKKRFSARLAGAILAAALCVGTCLPAGEAYGTAQEIVDYDNQIVAKQIEIDDLTARIEETDRQLDQAAVQAYKFASLSDTISWVLDSKDLVSFLEHIDYLNRIRDEYRKQSEALTAQLEELRAAQVEIAAMRDEKAERVRKFEEAQNSHYAQGDSRWADVPYYGGTMSWTGCGICAYASVIDILTGQEITPPEMLDIRGDWVGMDHYPDSTIGTPDGSTHAELTERLFDLNCRNIDKDELLGDISDDNAAAVVLVSGSVKQNNGAWWYTSGHYVCAYACEDGVLHVQDPAGLDAGRDVTYAGDDLDSFMSSIVSVVLYQN